MPETIINSGGTPEDRHAITNYIVINNRTNSGDTFQTSFFRCYVKGGNYNTLVKACVYEKIGNTLNKVAVGDEVLVKNFEGWKDFPISFEWESGKEYYIGLGGNKPVWYASAYLYFEDNVSGFTNYQKGFTYPNFPNSLDWWSGSRFSDEKSNIIVYGEVIGAVKKPFMDGFVFVE